MQADWIPAHFGAVRLQVAAHVAHLGDIAQRSLRAGTDPYWAHLSPSGWALAQALATHFEAGLEHQRVLELGCGPGTPGLVAAALGAKVLLTDLRAEALELVQLSAVKNGLAIDTAILDWSQAAPMGPFDLVLAADVLYADGMLATLLRFLKRSITPTGRIALTDPLRVDPIGLLGAARLHGLVGHHQAVVPGSRLEGGVNLFVLERGGLRAKHSLP